MNFFLSGEAGFCVFALFNQRANHEDNARELQDVAGQEPADGEPFQMIFRNGIPVFDRTVPPFAFEFAFGMVAELVKKIEQRDGKRQQKEYGGEYWMQITENK